MSSNLRIVKICETCKKEFIARTTVTQCCSDPCAKRLYKLKKRNKAIQQSKLKTDIISRPKAYITEEEIRAVNNKQFLTLKESAILMNVSPLTLRRWILGHKIKSKKLGKKHILDKASILQFIQNR